MVQAEYFDDSRHPYLSSATVHPSQEDLSYILPLSRSNLRLHDQMTRTAPSTTPSDGKSKSGKSGSHQVQNLEEQRRILNDFNLVYNKDEVFEGYEDFYTEIVDLVTAERNSTMKEGSIKSFKRERDLHAVGNETTVAHHLMPFIVKPTRQPNLGVDENGFAYYGDPRSWTDDFLIRNEGKNWIKRLYLIPDAVDDAILTALYADRDDLPTPKPDVTFGLHEGAFEQYEQRINRLYKNMVEICPGIEHAFLAVEWKPGSQPVEAAENQSRKNGAVLVHARRRLNAKAGMEQKAPGPDFHSYAFTCAAVPQLANIFVHWCEFKDGEEVYHMNLVSSHNLNLKSDISSLRQNVNNILDWGILKRKVEIKQVLKRIDDRKAAKWDGANVLPSKPSGAGTTA